MTKTRSRRSGCIVFFLLLLLAAVFLYAPVRDAIAKYLYPTKYSALVETYGEANGLQLSLVYAVIKNESSFRPDAVSSIGARGLMQMTEETFDWVQSRRGGDESFDDLFDPETSIDYGCYLLSVLLTEFGSVENALCAYHAGWGSVKQWLDNPEYSDDGATLDHIPFGDTRSYVKKVLDSIEIYQDLYGIA